MVLTGTDTFAALARQCRPSQDDVSNWKHGFLGEPATVAYALGAEDQLLVYAPR